MKHIISLICILFCLSSCIRSEYRILCKTVENDTICNEIFIVLERFGHAGHDVKVKIETSQINCIDTFYVFYYPVIIDENGSHQLTKYMTAKPLNFITSEYIKTR